MIHERKATFTHVAFTHFVPCFFIGIVMLFMADTIHPDPIMAVLADDMFSLIDFTLAALNGVMVGLVAAAYHFYRNGRLKRINAVSRIPASQKKITYAAIIGFISGASDVLLGLHNSGILALTVVVLVILILHLRDFSHHIVDMLKPGNIATWGDVNELMRIYMTMVAGFTLVNATLEGLHIMAGKLPPFGFRVEDGDIFLNSLYYTVVTMTTLGFGDIVPMTWDAKLLLIFQCLASYFMFALLIGIITRGVVRAKDKPGARRNRAS